MNQEFQQDLPGTSQWGHKNEHVSGVKDKGVHGNGIKSKPLAENAEDKDWKARVKAQNEEVVKNLKVPSFSEMSENQQEDGSAYESLGGKM